ncbi:MAG: thiosulfate oxidation carrier complex protein SoxZ [Thiolinea sp.]
MANSIKLKAKEDSGVVEVKALINHPMETGQRKDGDGNPIPAHFIKDLVIEADGKPVMNANWGGSVSKNPYVAVSYKGSKGQTVKLSWTDNKDESDSAETEVK